MALTVTLERSRNRPAGDSRFRRRALALRDMAGGVVSAIISPHKASLKRLAEIPLTVAGSGCVDFAAFHLAHGWGFLVTGISLVLLEHIIADDT